MGAVSTYFCGAGPQSWPVRGLWRQSLLVATSTGKWGLMGATIAFRTISLELVWEAAQGDIQMCGSWMEVIRC